MSQLMAQLTQSIEELVTIHMRKPITNQQTEPKVNLKESTKPMDLLDD